MSEMVHVSVAIAEALEVIRERTSGAQADADKGLDQPIGDAQSLVMPDEMDDEA